MITDLALARRGHDSAVARPAMARRGDQRLLPLLLGLTDTVMLVTAVGLAGTLRLHLDDVLPVVSLGFADRHIVASLLVVPVLLVLFRLRGLYDVDRVLAGSREYANVGSAVTYSVLIALTVSFFLGEGPVVSRSWLLLVWGLSIVCVGAGRFGLRRVVRSLRQRGLFRTRVVIVGASTFGIALAEQFRAARQEGVDVVGFLDEYTPLGQALVDDVVVIGRPSDVALSSRWTDVDELVLVPQALPHERMEEITSLMLSRETPRLRMAVSSSQLLTHGVYVAERASVPLVTLGRARIAGVDAVLKRTLDLVGASLGLVVLGPLAAVACARAALAGRHDLLYGVEIHGACGGKVTLWLFGREMSGWLPLRGVPALLAVLQGACSLVGPRPVLADVPPHHRAELGLTAMKPGLTGPWRLSGAGSTLQEQAGRDLAYVRDYTIWEDLHILWQSARGLTGGEGTDHQAPLARWQVIETIHFGGRHGDGDYLTRRSSAG